MDAGVHVQDFAGDARSQVGAEESGGVADFLDGDVALERRGLGVDIEQLAEAADAGSRQGADGAGGNAIDADAVGAQIVGHVADRKSTRLNSSHVKISYAVFCLKKKKKK